MIEDRQYSGCRKLVVAMISQAMDDYQALAHRGLIRFGLLDQRRVEVRLHPGTSSSHHIRKFQDYRNPKDVVELLHFFSLGGPCEYWLAEAGFDVDMGAVHSRLVKLEREPMEGRGRRGRRVIPLVELNTPA